LKKTYLTIICCLIISLTQAQDIVNIPDPVFKDWLLNYSTFDQTLQYLDANGDGEIQVSEAETLTELYIIDESLDGIEFIYDLTGIEAMVNLEVIDIQKFMGNTINLTENTNLERLNLGNWSYGPLDGEITDVDLSQNVNLTKLSIPRHKLTSIDLSNNINLSEIWLYNNQLSTIIFPDNVTLSELVLFNNQLTTLDVRNMGNIGVSETINISGNQISSFLFNDYQLRSRLNASGNLLTSLDVSQTNLLGLRIDNNPHLQYLNVKQNPGDAIDIIYANGCPNLSVVCAGNPAQWDNYHFYADQSTNVVFTEDCAFSEDDLNQITGTIRFDVNNDECITATSGMSDVQVEITNTNSNVSTSTYSNGFYITSVNEGTHTITPTNLPSYFTITPTSQDVTFVGYNNTETLDFCVTANQTVNDVNVTILPIREARPGFDTEYKLIYKNVGTTTQSGTVTFEFDDSLQSLVSANPAADASTANTLTYNYTDLQPFERREVLIKLNIFTPGIVDGGDLLPLIANITPTANDATLEDNTFEYNHFVVNSYDPNDKQVLQGAEIQEEQVDEYLDYLIRFQNTGTASAINVSVADELDAKLDWNTFQMVSASHPYEVNITNGNFVQFIFDDIFLPAEQDDEPGSHGYIAFKIKPKEDVVIGDIINGQASIYFDFNAPIITNEVSTEVVAPLSVPENSLDSSLRIYPNPTNNQFRIKTSDNIQIERVSMFSITGEQLFETSNVSESYDLNGYGSGVYFIKVETDKGSIHKRIIKN